MNNENNIAAPTPTDFWPFDVLTPRQVCPNGCGCRKGTEDADWSDCACDGPCCYADSWGPDAEFAARSEWWAEQ